MPEIEYRDGCEYGISCESCSYSVCFEDLALAQQKLFKTLHRDEAIKVGSIRGFSTKELSEKYGISIVRVRDILRNGIVKQGEGPKTQTLFIQCSKCKLQAWLEAVNGIILLDRKFSQDEEGKIYHIHKDDKYPCEEIRRII